MKSLPEALEVHDALKRGLFPLGGFVVLRSVHAREGKPLRLEARYFRSASVSAADDGSYLVEGGGGEAILTPSAALPSRLVTSFRRQSLRIEGPRGPGYALVFFPREGMAETLSTFLAKALESEAGMEAGSASDAALQAVAALRISPDSRLGAKKEPRAGGPEL
jgi:hypothetical protein